MPMPRTRRLPRAVAAALAVLLGACLAACAPVAPAASPTVAAPSATSTATPVATVPAIAAAATATTLATQASTQADASPIASPAAAGGVTGSAPHADVPSPEVAPPTPKSARADDRCRSDADCAVKDVGSCCGYNPRCVAATSKPDPAAVRASCAADGRVGTCGFREPTGCQCTDGHCAALAAPSAEVVR